MNEDVEPQAGGEVDEGLTIKGDLRESGLPELLKSLTQNRETGILTLCHDGTDKSIHLKDGRILFAASTDPDERLGEVLLRSGKLTVEEYFESSHHIRPGKRQGSVLVELGYITPDDLVRGVREQVEEIVYSLFQWTRGEYKMVLKELDTHDLITLNISTPELIFEGVRRIRAWSRIYRGLGSSMDVVLAHAPEADNIMYEMDLGEDESHLYGMANGRLTVQQICSMSYLTNFETCQALWGFLCVGALAPARETAASESAEAGQGGEAGGAGSSATEKVLDRYEVAFRAIHESLEELGEGTAASFLASALQQVKEHHSPVLGELAGDEEPVGHLRERRADEGEETAVAVESALQDLLYALLLLVRVKKGPEHEARISSIVTPLLHPSEDED